MAPGKGKGNGQDQGKGADSVTNAIFMLSLKNGSGSFAMIPFDQPNEDGETFLKNSAFVVRAIRDAVLEDVDPRYHRSLKSIIETNARALVFGAEPFKTMELDFEELTVPQKKTKPDTKPEPEPVVEATLTGQEHQF